MCRFAQECMREMNDLEANLADTLELIIRVGMNSRSVIPGVLPGEKGRFQLYVDTMDTASRMESNVVPGRLHVSQATADELMARGKKHWLTPREETIVANGKGELQTYFVDSTTAKSCLSSADTALESFDDVGSHDDLNLGTIEEA